MLGNLFAINAPFLINGVWKIIQTFLDEKTRKKIKILGTKYLPELTKYLDIENIPEYMGGKCKCEPYGCLKSNLGNWNNYDFDKDDNIVHKDDLKAEVELEVND